MAGVEEDDAPPHLNTVKFYSDHTLTGLGSCLNTCFFLDSQCMGEKKRARFTVTNQ